MSLSEEIKEISARPVPRGEENAKLKCIIPVLNELGWDHSKVEAEFEVGHGKLRGRVDFALMGPNGQPVALIEAKASSQALEDHVEQIVRYAFDGGAGICVLTRGLEWWLYLTQGEWGFHDRRFAVLNIKDDPREQLVEAFQAYLGREALLTKSAHKRAKQTLENFHCTEAMKAETPEVLQDMVDHPHSALVKEIRQRVDLKVGIRPTRDQITSFLRGSRVSITFDSDPPPPPPERGRPSGYKLWGKHYAVKSSKEVYVGVATSLQGKYREKFELLASATNKDRLTGIKISRDRLMRGSSLGSSGLFIYTNLNAKVLIRNCHTLLEHFGHSKNDLELVFQ